MYNHNTVYAIPKATIHSNSLGAPLSTNVVACFKSDNKNNDANKTDIAETNRITP